MSDVYVLGVNAYDHDVAACLLRNGEVVAAIAKERLTRVKNDAGFHQEPIDYVLACAGISPARVDLVVMNSYLLPVPELERLLLSSVKPYYLDARERRRATKHPYFLGREKEIATCSHHLAHAYSAFAVSPFESGAVMVVDGIGSYRSDVVEAVPKEDEAHGSARESESYYLFEGSRIETVKKVFMGPARGVVNDDFFMLPGLGALYSRVSTYIFGHWNRCGEVMGLAPYGEPGDGPPLAEVVDGRLEIPEWPRSLVHPFPGGSDREWEASERRKEWEDLAWRVQEDTERALVARANRLHERTGATNLAIAGGVALNCVANARILAETPFERVFIQPAAGDDGIALGCAYYGHLALLGGRRTFVMRSPALGRQYPEADVESAISGPRRRGIVRSEEPADIHEETARRLARGEVVGWFMGRSEFGPRALGFRSILADPRDPGMKDRLNARVKHRQGFRPFAPAVLAERAGDYFEGDAESPFMILVKRVRPEMRDVIPAVMHVDGTARVQTVREEESPHLFRLLAAFHAQTGVAVLLNTSFNVRGDPIVETPQDAVEAFLATEIDVLAIHDRVVTKRGLYRLLRPFVRTGIGIRRNLRLDAVRERLARSVLEGAPPSS